MDRASQVRNLTITALLIAVGIIIPMYSPVKLVIPPASYTLASHVAIFIAMFISPSSAVAVAIGTTLGFFIGGFPIVIVLRAATHLVFALLGAFFLKKDPAIIRQPIRLRLFSLVVALLHGALEACVVAWFYAAGQLSDANYQSGFFLSVIVLVGFGSVLHSLIDFEISLIVVKALQKQKVLRLGGADQ